MLKPGDIAPDFELPNADMELVRLGDFKGRNSVVVYFYPKDDTPGCTIEAIELSDLMDDFERAGAVVLGISKDNCASHGEFRDKHGLTVTLLADLEGTTCDDYGVWHQKEAHGKTYMGIMRSTFIVDKEGVIRQALYDVKPKGHASQVLGLVQGL